MGTIVKLFMLLLLVLSFLGFVSCSDDSGSVPAGEFIEVELDGVSRVAAIENSVISGSGEFCFLSSTDIDDVDFMLTMYSDLDRLALSPAGEYRFCPYDEPRNLDFEISVSGGNYNYVFCKRGTHTVTAVKRSGDAVVVEGKFQGTLEDDRGISGRYRMAVW
jgi:hypothetical protein